MKNKILIVSILFALSVASVRAQYSDYYYHRVGDTIEWQSEIGYYSWWEWKEFYDNHLPIVVCEKQGEFWSEEIYPIADSGIVLERFYTPVPLKIVGIAGMAYRGHFENHGIGVPMTWVPDTSSVHDYFLIYDAIGDHYPLVAQVEWSPSDTMRTLHIKNRRGANDSDSCCAGNVVDDLYLPLKEYYFDNPVYVEDSFYVGGTYFGGLYNYLFSGGLNTIYGGAITFYNDYPCNSDLQRIMSVLYNSYVYQNGCAPINTPLMRHKGFCNRFGGSIMESHPRFEDYPWRWVYPLYGACMMVYPLIEVDTTMPPQWACDSIQNVQVTVEGTSATVTWDGFPNYSRILLRYGRINEPQSQWREYEVTGNTLYTLENLAPVSFYCVALKAECDICKKETPWSEPVTFYVAADTSGGGNTEGIEGTTLLSQLTFLQPNPAQDEVTVTSSFSLTAIDIWTADGVMVYHGGCTGHDATVDVSWLRAGTYIVAIHTHNGTTHKRLLVAR